MANVTINQWVAQSQARLEAVWKTAAQDIVREIQTPRAKNGRMPVDTSFLRTACRKRQQHPYRKRPIHLSEGPVSIVIGRAKIGDTVVFGMGGAI